MYIIVFTLSEHTALQSGTRGEYTQHERHAFHVGVFSDGITGCLQPPRGKNIRSEKYRIDDIFHS